MPISKLDSDSFWVSLKSSGFGWRTVSAEARRRPLSSPFGFDGRPKRFRIVRTSYSAERAAGILSFGNRVNTKIVGPQSSLTGSSPPVAEKVRSRNSGNRIPIKRGRAASSCCPGTATWKNRMSFGRRRKSSAQTGFGTSVSPPSSTPPSLGECLSKHTGARWLHSSSFQRFPVLSYRSRRWSFAPTSGSSGATCHILPRSGFGSASNSGILSRISGTLQASSSRYCVWWICPRLSISWIYLPSAVCTVRA